MKTIIDEMRNKKGFACLNKPTEHEIAEAEKALGIRFAEDYKQYVSVLGVATFDGHELTGICKSDRLNVITVTRKERVLSPGIPMEWYVIEKTNIDNNVIWQNENGEIMQTINGKAPTKLCDSMLDYINLA